MRLTRRCDHQGDAVIDTMQSPIRCSHRAIQSPRRCSHRGDAATRRCSHVALHSPIRYSHRYDAVTEAMQSPMRCSHRYDTMQFPRSRNRGGVVRRCRSRRCRRYSRKQYGIRDCINVLGSDPRKRKAVRDRHSGRFGISVRRNQVWSFGCFCSVVKSSLFCTGYSVLCHQHSDRADCLMQPP